MKVCEWTSVLPEIADFRSIAILTVGKMHGQFTPNITVTVRNALEGETLQRHYDVSKVVGSAEVHILEARRVQLGEKQLYMQTARAQSPGGTPLDQKTGYFLWRSKAVVATLSTLEGELPKYDAVLREFVENFELV